MEKTSLPQGVTLADRSRAHELVSDFKPQIDHLGILKRGDWIRLLIEWVLGQPPAYSDQHGCEFLTCLVSSVANGLIKCRVLCAPTFTEHHTLKYGDDLTVSPRHVMLVDPLPTTAADGKGNVYPLSPEQMERNIRILLAGPAEPIVPSPGGRYWTRNGMVANVWTILTDPQTQQVYFLGEAGGQPNIQWAPDGRHRGGNTDLDIIKNPDQTEVLGL
jgi:hypothetical protein